MTGKTYYVDSHNGANNNDGLKETAPVGDYRMIDPQAGDTVLFKRNTIMRDTLDAKSGTSKAKITYGAYGNGNKPAFYGSLNVSDKKDWIERAQGIWEYSGSIDDEVCNIIYNNGESYGTMRWAIEDLSETGDWFSPGIGKNSKKERNITEDNEKGSVYICSPFNPGILFTSIECALWGSRKLVSGKEHIVIKDLRFQNSGVHGYHETGASDVIIRNCEFANIGGAVWDGCIRVRFGNAVEFWDGANDILVEDCQFREIYDAGVTHQGGGIKNVPERIRFSSNLFINCGFAAYESREPSKEIFFEYNTCVNTGGGFSMQGEDKLRVSSLYPHPVGNHVFMWMIDKGTQPGRVYIRNNIFYEAPYGCAVFSLIDPEDEANFVFDYNTYWQTKGKYIARIRGKYYRAGEFCKYQTESGNDVHGIAAKPEGEQSNINTF